jgi:hypothetical protein
MCTSVDDDSPAADTPAHTFDGEHHELEHASENELEDARMIGFPHAGRMKHGICHASTDGTSVIPRVRDFIQSGGARWAAPHAQVHADL